MRSFLIQAFWLASVVTAQQQVITITEYRKCSTSAVFSAPTYNSTQSPSQAASPSAGEAAPLSSSSVPPPTVTGGANPFPGGLGATGPSGPGALSPAAQNNVDYLYWMNYARAVMKAAEFLPGGDKAFFVGREALKGPPAGDNIPEEYTNLGLHAVANNLMNDSNPFYEPSGLYRYVEALQDYLDYVDLEGQPSAEEDEQLLEARQDFAAAHQHFLDEQDAAYDEFQIDEGRGFTNGKTFDQWVASGKAPGLEEATRTQDQRSAVLESISNKIAGPKAAARTRDRLAITNALKQTPLPGYNMNAATGILSSPRQLQNCLLDKKQCPVPPIPVIQLPLYTAQGYKPFVSAGQRKVGTPNAPTKNTSFSIDTAEETSSFQFGQTSIGASASPGGWFSFWRASAGRETSSTTLRTGSAASSVSIKMTYEAIEQIPVTPGLWNFNPGQYRLLDSAPKNIKELYRPTSLVVARRLGYEITVSSALASSLDTQFKETVSAKGGFRIFGISIGASYSKTDVRNTHEASWNKATATMTILPKDDTGAATLIGVIGEKFAMLG